MGYTITEKLLMKAANMSEIRTGQLILADVDFVLGNDITTPVAIKELKSHGINEVFDKEKIAIVLDHFVPNKDIKSAEQCRLCREYAREHAVTHFYDVGTMGIEHALLPEKGLVKTSDVVVGADSHTCTYGALGAFSTGIGSTDMAMAMATGRVWLRVPAQVKVILTGAPKQYVSGKDIILTLIGMLGVDGALYKTLEFCGSGVHYLTMEDRFTICNMAIECGAKNGIFACDAVTAAYEHERGISVTPVVSDGDAVYQRIVEIDLSSLAPVAAFPSLPSNVHTLPLSEKIKVDQVLIGSCTNGRYGDIAKAAAILSGRHVCEGVRLIVTPATQETYLRCLRAGYLETIIRAGGVVSTPTCGACLGGHMGILASGEVCASTTNRNFVGRMGATDSSIYLVNPEIAAATAILGYLGTPNEIR